MTALRLLITGAHGFLGWNLMQQARKHWQVHSLVHRNCHAVSGVQNHAGDITDAERMQALLDQIKPHALIHLAAMSSPNACQKQPLLSRLINVEASEQLASFCHQRGISLVFTSSSQVFDGEHAPYDEDSPTQPRNLYGEQKLEAEQRILAAHPNACICRVPLMYGAAPEGCSSALQMITQPLRQAKQVALFVDEYRSVLGATSAARGLLLATQWPGQRVILAGNQALSRYAFGVRVAEYLALDYTLIKPVYQREFVQTAGRPRDLTMRNDKARRLGFEALPIEAELQIAEAQ